MNMKTGTVLLLAAVLAGSCGKKEQPPPDRQTGDFAPGTVSGSIYENPAYRFRFTVPAGWRLQEGGPAADDESSVLLVAGIHESLLESFMFNAQKGFNRSGMGALGRLDHMFAALGKTPGFTGTVRESLAVGGAAAARVEYRVGGEESRPESFYLFVHNDNTVTFASAAPAALPEQLRGDIAAILSSLEFY